MKFEEFRSGAYKQQFQYQSFSPEPINHLWTWEDPTINTLLERATQTLGELNAFSFIVPDVDMFIQMHIAKEANTSSKIEGTQTRIDEALMEKEQLLPEKRDDWQEVNNYIEAMNTAIESLKDLPLSSRLLKQIHSILMQSARGEHKTPGEFRRSQNWIGGTSIKDAVFVPPHDDEIPELIGDLEKFWYNEEISVPNLIRIAISHYQFETIHPFLDGNGRIGRLMITLYLVSKGLLEKPSLYLSDYFEKHKGAYYDALTVVRASNNLIHWVKFFLIAVIETAEKGKTTFQEILKLRNQVDGKVVALGRKAENARNLLMYLYKKPIVNATVVAKNLGLSSRATNELLKDMENMGLLKEMTGYKRNRVFAFDPYLKLFLD